MRWMIKRYHDIVDFARNTGISKIPFVKRSNRAILSVLDNFVKNSPQWVQHSSSYLYLDPTDHVGKKIYKFGTCEPLVEDEIQRQLKVGETAIDIGAHIGHHTVTMRNCVGDSGNVLVFEPHPQNSQYLRKTINRNGWTNVNLYEKALSDEEATYTLAESTNNTGNSSIMNSSGNSYEIDSIRFSDLYDELELGTIDLIKIDIEGAEINVIRDMAGTVLKHVNVMLLEVHTQYLSKSELNEIYDILAPNGRLTTIDGDGLFTQKQYRNELSDVLHRNLIWERY
jgi:FkbM family methyltransferase